MSESAPRSPAGPLRLLSDKRLAQRAAGGDRHAFEAIYSRYHQSLYRFCLAMVGNPQDAQDSLQNAMVKVLRALPGEKREIQLKPWLYRIARNESVETLRRRRESDELAPDLAATVGVAETAEARERLRALLADLGQLPERQRAALVMRELSGLDFAEIGAAFGSSAAVARQTLYEARLSLRQLEAGREMRCADVMRELSDADGRVTRRREIRAHLRGCADCRAFREQIAKRHEDLAAIAPLPVAASAGLLHGALGGGGGASGAGIAGSVGAGTGKVVATSAIVKSAATVAVVAVVGVSAADRGGLIDLPLAGGRHDSTQSAQESRAAASGGGSSGGADSAGTGASKQRTGHGAGSDSQTTNSNPASSNGSSPTKSDAAPGDGSSNSQAGASPPGGGYGRSASERHGRPEQLPAAADHGQQTAAAHKSPHAASPPGQSASGSGKGNSSGGGKGKSSGGGGPPAAKPPHASSNGKSETAGPPTSPPDKGPSKAHGGPPD